MNPSWSASARAALAAFAILAVGTAAWGLTIPNSPLSVQRPVKPLVMLVSGKDHRLFYEAYNDASDIDGDRVLDTRFKPGITYLGLFNPDYCYTHSGKGNTGLFTPAAAAAAPLRTCSKMWSGNWLNYVTTSRIDALRVVLYGGMREVDTAESTVLRRAYVPQDAHSWAKEYTSQTVDGYKIEEFTPLAAPNADKRHFFGNLTPNAGVDCATLSNCSDLAPTLSVVTNSDKRVWDWASSNAPVLRNDTHAGTRADYTVRVKACAPKYRAGCKRYGDKGFKPVGLLHEYGENDAMLFGLLTGSYDNNMAGGRLRKVVSSFGDEVDPLTGQFTGAPGIVQAYDALRIRDFNNGNIKNTYRGGWLTNAAPAAGKFPDWGNPIGEMMYETLRYFAGKGSPTAAYGGETTLDASVGLPLATWDDPFSETSAAKAPYCARASMLVISDVNVSYDSDQVPGSYFAEDFTGDLDDFDAKKEADAISASEPDVSGQRFIGQSQQAFDSAPTAKAVESLGTVRGLAPEEPTKQGSYHAAAVAAFGKRSDLHSKQHGHQTVDTFAVVMASPLPRIEVPMPGGRRITLVPFAKSVYGEGEYPISSAKGAYQPTNQIVDLYVESIANSGPADQDDSINGGRYQAKFRINFEDVEQGADHDMDIIAEYEIKVTAEGTLSVTVHPLEQSGLIQTRIGYVISGTEKDGIYLVAQNKAPPADAPRYFLDTPNGTAPGDCDKPTPAADCLLLLPYTEAPTPPGNSATRSFRAGSVPAATLLKDPLWYAAKWGGHIPRDENRVPDRPPEWDSDEDGVPDSYLLVHNPARLLEALRTTLESIAKRNSSASNVAINSTGLAADSMVFQAVFNTTRWAGDLVAYRVSDQGLKPAPAWQAADRLTKWEQRRIFMASPNGETKRWTAHAQLSKDDQTSLGNAQVFNYLRGERAGEVHRGGKLRDRGGVLGDIVHSSPYFDPVAKLLYVGANDGALHAFDSEDGAEVFAFIPRESVSRLARLAKPGYVHEYFVDGDIVMAPRSDLTGSKAYLFALMGRGGRGLFALDVTNAADTGPVSLWEYTPAASSEAELDPYLGKMLGRPVIVPLNNGKLGVIAGNGYESASGRAVLYVFVVNTDGSLDGVHTLATGAAGDAAGPRAVNGLAAPAVVDTNHDGKADLVFAGDLQGNLWKFDISASQPQAWHVAHGAKPLFTAIGPDKRPQPITAAPYLARKPLAGEGTDPHAGRLFVFFGTGSYFKTGDTTDASVQSWYGLLADTPEPVSGRDALRQRSVAQTGTVAGRPVRTFSAATAGDMDKTSGWYLDFTRPVPGERVITASRIVDFTVPLLMASSIYPVLDEPCTPGGRGFLNVIEPFTGAAAGIDVLDANRNRQTDDDRLDTVPIGSLDPGIGLLTEATVITMPSGDKVLIVGGSGKDGGKDGEKEDKKEDKKAGDDRGTLIDLFTPGVKVQPVSLKGRLSWREIVRE